MLALITCVGWGSPDKSRILDTVVYVFLWGGGGGGGQERSQDFSRGGSVCRNFANHTHFLKTTPKLKGTCMQRSTNENYCSLQKSS